MNTPNTLENIPETTQNIPTSQVPISTITHKLEPSSPGESQETEVLCPICFDSIPEAEITKPLECQHAFCRSCLVEYLVSKINNFKVLNISCPSSDCNCLFTEAKLAGVLDAETLNRYKHFVIKKTTRQDELKFCPKPGCAESFKPCAKSAFTVCKCGTKICNLCANPQHEGKSCLEMIDPEFEEYTKKEGIKFCMICKTHVLRVEGCMHITCPICDYEWCWECGREYKNSNHQSICPKKWSPAPPKSSLMTPVKKIWTGSTLRKIALIFGGLLLSPLILIALVLFWPLFRFFDIEEDFGKNRLKSAKLIFLSIIMGITLTPLVLLFGACYLIAQVVIIPFKWTLKMDLEEMNTRNNNGAGDRQAPENQPAAAKKEVRWVKRDAQKFFYTTHSRPELETEANTNATEGDIEAQILRRPMGVQPQRDRNRNGGNRPGNTVFDRAWQNYNVQTLGGFRIY